MSSSQVNLEDYQISLEEIRFATEDFNPKRCIGGGGFGMVYVGELSDRWQSRTAAIKRLSQDSYQGELEFRNELEMISKFHHENIISFIGYCDEGNEKILVFDYAINGSFDCHLQDQQKRRCLTWIQRLEICLGTARGLNYLHTGLGDHNRVIHRDVKSANILLDENFVPKLCDFGLSKIGPRNQPNSQLYTKVAGTQFYVDPLYHESGILRKESDVYSFGVVMFEILSGMLVHHGRIIGDDRQRSLITLVRRYYDNELDKLIDPFIRDQIDRRSFGTFREIACQCINFNLVERPTMDKVIERIKEAINFQILQQASTLSPHSASQAQVLSPHSVSHVQILQQASTLSPHSASQAQVLSPHSVSHVQGGGWNLIKDTADGIIFDEVIIKQAEKEDEATVIIINCPDKIGLGCDLCRTILFFDLSIVRCDVSTDGIWCYIVFWVVGKPGTRWSLLKKRLSDDCPSCSFANTLYCTGSRRPKPADVFLIKLCCHDREGFLHDIIGILCELELVIKRVKEATTLDGMVTDLFFVTDTRELLHTKKRKKDTYDHLKVIFEDNILSCEIERVGTDFTACAHDPPSFIPPDITQDMFNPEMLDENKHEGVSVSVTIDNISPAHTLLQIVCHDHKGVLNDIMRTLKDNNIQISYGRFTRNRKSCELELFIVQADGKKITDPGKQSALCSRIRMELDHPLRVGLVNCGPDTELLVANPVELCGKGRSLVLYDITLALKMMNIDILSAEISRHLIGGLEWEVYRVLLNERDEMFVPKNKIKEAVRKMLIGWDQ